MHFNAIQIIQNFSNFFKTFQELSANSRENYWRGELTQAVMESYCWS